jgi:hypothetical protein
VAEALALVALIPPFFKEKKKETDRAFVAAGGKLPGGFGHGLAKNGKPLLHSGFKHFEM